ncbi:14 kDa proline-rich protein DC2.15-like [Silene latifolia]|uniref:14 kDa proline-rich protein DC2.15-like n=1 Tax=Silene latifolia TaxID=37657 RepID=UPI003D76B055
MASSKAIIFVLCLNLVFFTLVSSDYVPTPTPSPPPPPPTDGKCPNDTLKITACLDAALCLCTRLEADLLGIAHLNLSVTASVLVKQCSKAEVITEYQCPN